MDGIEQRAICRVCRDLGLPAGDSFSQDWAYELPESLRDEALLYRCLSLYVKPGYGVSERRIIVQLALDLANDLFQEDDSVGRKAWSALADLLRIGRSSHKDQVEYWAMLGEPLENAFSITPLARALWAELYAK